MATSYSRGHKTYYDWDTKNWRYSDNNEIVNDTRPCKKCGCSPTKEGYDACLGHIDGAIHACCGHGAEKGYIMYPDKTVEINGDLNED